MVGLAISAHNPPVNILHVKSLFKSQLPDGFIKSTKNYKNSNTILAKVMHELRKLNLQGKP